MAKEIKNLTDENIEEVCKILDGWGADEKLTWNTLIKAIEDRLLPPWSRQALDRHVRIKQAFKLRKKARQQSVPSANDENMPVDLRKAMERISRLENENERITLENHRLLEQFRRWAYNAQSKGFTIDVLDKSLPEVNRRGTRDEP